MNKLPTSTELPEATFPFKTPKAFPVKAGDALACWLPQTRVPDRWHDWRRFLKYCQNLNQKCIDVFGGPAKPEYGLTLIDPLLSETEFHLFGPAFLKWRKELIKQKRSNAGRLGGETTAKQLAEKAAKQPTKRKTSKGYKTWEKIKSKGKQKTT